MSLSVALSVGVMWTAALAPLGEPTSTMPLARPDLMLPSSEENLAGKAVREAMVNFARCVARRRPMEANDFVLQVSQATWTALRKRIDDSCALEAVADPGEEVRVSTNSQDLLFALAEVLTQRKLGSFEPTQIASAAKLPLADPLLTIGECAVRANPIGARDLLKTNLNSKDEGQAVQALMPAFASCIPSGMQVRFDVTNLRGTVAVNYYRLAFAPKVTQAETQE